MKSTIITALLAQAASASEWGDFFNFGICAWSMPQPDTLNEFSQQQFAGQWYEVQRDNSLTDWGCVTQEVNYDSDISSWPLTIYHYVNGNRVIEPELGSIEKDGQGDAKMLGATKKLTVLKSDLQSDDGYALIYSCATNFWLFGIPRKTETAWVLSKKP